MKKKLSLVLSMIVMAIMLCACGTDPTTVDYNGYSYTDLEDDANQNLTMVQNLIMFYAQNGLTQDDINDDLVDYLVQNGVNEAEIDASFKWMEVEDLCGSFVDIKENSFSVEKAGKTLTTKYKLQFEKKDVDFQVVYSYYNMEITGITIEPVYSLGEKMEKAALNTVISICIVFAVLILISLIIYCFNIFPYIEKKKKEKLEAKAVAAPVQDDLQTSVEEAYVAETDDTELIAVIAAAIAASEGTSTSDFVVRSINRR